MASRKDSKGHVLKTGESQRKDGTYMYRYTDTRGKRQSVYAPNLLKLRDKEKTIQIDLNDGIDYAAGNTTVFKLVQRYFSLKNGLKKSTSQLYEQNIKAISGYDFVFKKIKDVKPSDAKQFVIDIHNDGKKTSTVRSMLNVVIPAFDMACDDDIIRKNPFNFSISEVLPNDKSERIPLTQSQQESLLKFVKETKRWSKYYDMINVMLGTGVRVSEYCGLTVDDIDFENRRIFVNKQQMYLNDNTMHIEKPKTEHGIRYIPITNTIYQSLKNLVERSQNNNRIHIVDGYHGFIALKPNGNMLLRTDINNALKHLKYAYNDEHPTTPIKRLTPHILRHTFCTNMVNAGMDIKSLQYLMGHANASITLNVYAHSSYDNASAQMFTLIDGGKYQVAM